MSATVRINPENHRKLKVLSEELGASMPIVLEQAIEALRRQRFLEQAERKVWDKTLKDGLGKE